MYRRFYGLHRQPFDLHPDPERVFMSETHKEALAILRYGVMARKGFLLLTGDVGTGKTTLLQALVHDLPGNVHCCLLNNPTLSRDEFLQVLARSFALGPVSGKADFLDTFNRFLAQCRDRDERALLIVDEAHVMPVDLLEEVRLLSNQDSGGGVLSIFLVGQPELNHHLAADRLLPLRQRIGVRFHLDLFDRDTTRQYILFRLRSAGASSLELFTAGAMNLVHEISRGTPRLINMICDHALLSGFADGKAVIDTGLIQECVRDLHLAGDEAPLPGGQGGDREPTTRWRLVSVVVLVLAIVLLLVELVPQTRAWSPLGWILPEEWRQWLHQMVVLKGGNGG